MLGLNEKLGLFKNCLFLIKRKGFCAFLFIIPINSKDGAVEGLGLGMILLQKKSGLIYFSTTNI